MKQQKYRFKPARRFKILLLLVLLYLLSTVGYYFLPWSVRKPIYTFNPSIDRTLRLKGLKIIQGWDGLGISGSDRRAAVDPGHRGDHVYGGYPVGDHRLTFLENEGYVVGYSESLRNPRWVAYRMFDVPSLESGPRPSFLTDRRTRARVAHGDYTHSGYDRGHMAPNYGIATRYGADGQRETFLMSNIIPQTPRINRYLWRDLERTVAERYGRYFEEVWVMTGPVFKGDPPWLPSGVAIPAGYFKILADERSGKLRVMAFLVAADCPPYARIKAQMVSVDRIEELTGLDFFPELPAEAQTRLESKPAGRLWPWYGAALQYRNP